MKRVLPCLQINFDSVKMQKRVGGGRGGWGATSQSLFPFIEFWDRLGKPPPPRQRQCFHNKRTFMTGSILKVVFDGVTFSRSSKHGHMTTWEWYQETWRWTDPAPFLHSENRCWIPRTLWAKKKLTSSHQYEHMTIIIIICSYLLPDPPLNVWCASPASLDQPC